MFILDFQLNFFKKKFNEIMLSSFLKKMDYVQLRETRNRDDIYFCNMGKFISFYKLNSRVPKTFEDKYFHKKDLENLLELDDILDNLKN